MVSRKLAMRNEPNIGLRCCSSGPKIHWMPWVVNQSKSKKESPSCRCTTASIGEMRITYAYVWLRHSLVSTYAWKFSLCHWSFLGPGAELMTNILRENGHPTFRATRASDRGQLKSKGGGQLSIISARMMLLFKRFFVLLFLSISAESSGQSQICVRNSSLHRPARRELMQLWNNQSQW